MNSSDEGQDRTEILVENIRTSLRQYPARKIHALLRIPLYVLQCYALTIEVFLHREFGERYLSWIKVLIGFAMLYMLGIVAPPYNWKPVRIADLPIQYLSTLLNLLNLLGITHDASIKIPTFNAHEVDGVDIFPLLLLIYYAFAQWRLIEIFFHNRFNTPPHPKSSGETYNIWNSFYITANKLNFHTDLVKQIFEPTICFLFGLLFCGLYSINKAFGFIAFWLLSGTMCLFLKAYIENRGRKALYLDRIGSDMDLEAFRMQQRLIQSSSDGTIFSEVKSPEQ